MTTGRTSSIRSEESANEYLRFSLYRKVHHCLLTVIFLFLNGCVCFGLVITVGVRSCDLAC